MSIAPNERLATVDSNRTKDISDEENVLFCCRNILLGKLHAKRQRRQERRAKETLPSSTWKNQSSLLPFTVTSGSPSNLPNGTPGGLGGVNRSASSSSMYEKKPQKKKSEQDLKRKLTKDDIGLPSNFRWIIFYLATRHICYSLEHTLA